MPQGGLGLAGVGLPAGVIDSIRTQTSLLKKAKRTNKRIEALLAHRVRDSNTWRLLTELSEDLEEVRSIRALFDQWLQTVKERLAALDAAAASIRIRATSHRVRFLKEQVEELDAELLKSYQRETGLGV